MARRPARKSPRSSSTRSTAAPAASGGDRDRIIATVLALLAKKPIEQIGFAEIAEEAGVSLAQLRGEFASTLAILAAHIKAVDRAVLAADFGDMAEEPPRERLFDVLMRRLEILAPHRAIRRSLWRSTVSPCARSNGCWPPPTSAHPARAASCARKGLRSCSARCCAPGLTTTMPALPAPWRRSTGRWRAANASRASLTTFATSRRGCAGCARGGGGATTVPRRLQRHNRNVARPRRQLYAALARVSVHKPA